MNTADSPPLTLGRDDDGQFILPADMLAVRFGWPVETLQDYMRRGMVTSRVERGEGEDDGRWRLSVRCGNRRWQAVVEANGTVSRQTIEIVPPGGMKGGS